MVTLHDRGGGHVGARKDSARLFNVEANTLGVDADLVRAVQQRRSGELLNLDRMLRHSAPVARGKRA